MTWDAYIEEHLLHELKEGSGRTLSFAAIIGLDGGIWAQSSDFPDASPEQIEVLINAFDDETVLQEKGIHLGDNRYIAIQGEAGSVIRGKKGPTGFTAKKTKTAFVIGGYSEGTQPGECNVVVENVADELIGDDY
mgnify:CR=1 FL=1